jgi:hypothetical protein
MIFLFITLTTSYFSTLSIFFSFQLQLISTVFSLWVCLDGEKISVRIALFGLVVENSVRLVISREI